MCCFLGFWKSADKQVFYGHLRRNKELFKPNNHQFSCQHDALVLADTCRFSHLMVALPSDDCHMQTDHITYTTPQIPLLLLPHPCFWRTFLWNYILLLFMEVAARLLRTVALVTLLTVTVTCSQLNI